MKRALSAFSKGITPYRTTNAVIFLILLIGIISITGCVNTKPSEPSIVPSVPTTVVTPDSLDTSIPKTVSPDTSVTSLIPTIATVNVQDKETAPYVNIVGIKRAHYSIPNCTMGQLVPEVQDPKYGLNSVKQHKLVFLSNGEFNRVIREYTEDKNAFSMCYGVPVTPTWDFVNFVATLTARNARPQPYNISMVIKFRGVDGPSYNTTMTLNPGQQYPFSVYVPIQEDQIGNIDAIEFKFNQEQS